MLEVPEGCPVQRWAWREGQEEVRLPVLRGYSCMQQPWRRGCYGFPGSMPTSSPHYVSIANPTPCHRQFIPVVQGHRASGWWEWNWYPGQPGRLLEALHSSRAPRRTYTSQRKRTIHEGVRPGDSLLICSAGHALGG